MQLIIVAAASKFNIEPKRVGEWRSVAEKFNTVKVNRKWLDGGGRNCLDVELDEEVACWVYSMRQKMLHVSRKMIMFKAKKIFDDKTTDPASRDAFVASRGWCRNIMRRYRFSLRRNTTTAQKDPSYLIDRLVSFVMHARQLQRQYNFAPHNIVAMDESAVWNDMVSETTGHGKLRVSVCFAAKLDGIKLKTFIVFGATKRESKSKNVFLLGILSRHILPMK